MEGFISNQDSPFPQQNSFGTSNEPRRGGRRRNISNFNSTAGGGLSGLFRTMNAVSGPNNNFMSAAEAMGDDNIGGLNRSSSIFNRPSRNNITHIRHSSMNVDKEPGRHFETEVDGKFEGLEEQKVQGVNTFDQRHQKNSLSMYNTFDAAKNQRNRRTNSMSFNFMGNTFQFRRTISREPTLVNRKKVSRQLSIQKNVDAIRRQSSVNMITCRI